MVDRGRILGCVRLLTCVAGLAALLALGAAGTASASRIKPTAVVPSVARLVPADDRGRTFVSPENATYYPDEFVAGNGHTIEGMDPEMLDALAKIMGIKVTLTNVPFDDIIPGIVRGKYQLSMSSIDDTTKRETQISLVDYAHAGQRFVTYAGSGVSLRNMGDMCGLAVAVQYGTTELSYVSEKSTECLVAGSKPVTVVPFANQTLVDNALRRHRVKLALADTPVADSLTRASHGKLVLVGPETAIAPFGVAVPKGSRLLPALRAGMRYLQAHGYYTAILKRWGLESIAIPASKMVVNGAGG
ncbi:MAG TPA: ABC transporter substrate-binding protein [Solirubrobacteraceae bacterium]|jgi:polar amino acid transport system substrate-binding protein|nr:ABC transporter substrate-binding protein [Solirubrobacteraceae bacterium]